ncbi:MAG: hypothetical protein HGA85_08735 [Nanoarchaeota archaeon]|nr:hypothetical protein [Nanoarchaeota archaeon]
MRFAFVFVFISAFLLGAAATFVYFYEYSGWEMGSGYSTTAYVIASPKANLTDTETDGQGSFIEKVLGYSNEEKPSPIDRIPEQWIKVDKHKVVIEIENAVWSKFTDTNSMDPVLDKGANAIEIVPEKYSDVAVGDIIAFASDYSEGTVIHRVTEVGEDENGWYCRTKGDNNPRQDPGKIRFSQVKRVIVAIIY